MKGESQNQHPAPSLPGESSAPVCAPCSCPEAPCCWDAEMGKGIWGEGKQGTVCLWDVKTL